jgi:D-alanine transaminase
MTNKNNKYSAFFNGQYMPIEAVAISPFDRGFLLGDSIYEAIPAYHNHMLASELHLQRLSDGLHSVGIKSPFSTEQWTDICNRILLPNQDEQLVYIQVTRGNEQQRKHRFPVTAEPTVLVFSIPFNSPIDAQYKGCAAHLQNDLRWQCCHVKSTSLMANVLSYRQLHLDGVANDEALLVRDGLVVEAPSSNLFIAKNTTIYTPPVDNILPGVTRALVIDIAIQQGYEVKEITPSIKQLKNADEVWVTNSLEEIKPIISVDNQPIATGQPGDIWRQLFDAFQTFKTNLE